MATPPSSPSSTRSTSRARPPATRPAGTDASTCSRRRWPSATLTSIRSSGGPKCTPATSSTSGRRRRRSVRRRASPPSPERLQRGQVLRQPVGDLDGEVGRAEVGIGPRLGDPPPRPAALGPDELADDGLSPERPPPPRLALQQPLDDGFVVGDLRVLAVEPHLQREDRG